MAGITIVCENCLSKLYVLDEEENSYYCPLCEQEKIVNVVKPETSFLVDNLIPESTIPVNDDGGFLEDEFDSYIVKASDSESEAFTASGEEEKRSPEEIRRVIEDKKERLKREFDSQKARPISDNIDPYVDSVSSIVKINENKKTDTKVFVNFLLFLVVLLMSLVVFFAWRHYHSNKLLNANQEELKEAEKLVITSSDFVSAEEFARAYIQIETLEEAIQKAIPDNSLQKRMAQLWQPFTNEPDLKFILMDLIPRTQFAVFYYQHILPDGEHKKALVYMTPDRKFFFDWRSYEGIQDITISDLAESVVDSTFLIRVKAKKNDYYNYGYHENSWRSFKLFSPNESNPSDFWLNAYANYEVSRDINRHIDGGKQRLLLEVKWKGEVAEIVDMVSHKPSEYSFLNLSDIPND